MEEKQKIKRKWMGNEETALIQYVLVREEELFGDMKGAGSKKKAALKREGWDEICQILNSQFINLRREPGEIKKKFFNLRQRVKKKIDFIKRALRGTGGGPGPPPLTAGEEAVALSLQNRPVAGGIDGEIDTDELYSDGNVALGKSASSSSVFNYLYPYGPNLAVDAILDHGVYGEGPGCFMTSQEAKPYLQINLGREYRIIFLRMFNRVDCCGDRLHDVIVLASPVDGEFMLCGFYKGPGKTREIVDIPCKEGTVGQIVKIQITRGTLNYLQLCEVEIYAL